MSDIYANYAFFLKWTFGPTFLGDDRLIEMQKT